MADFTEHIKVLIDTETAGAVSGLSGMKGKITEAEGAFGKMKAGASGAFDTIKAAGPLAVAGASAAIGAFALKAVGDFQDLALAAQNFSTVAGTSVEDASRWVEVSDDLGVSADTVSGAMGRLNREAATGKLAAFGIDASNANDRLIQAVNYLQQIPDEAARSQAAFQLFGKSYASLAPLIASAGELKDRLADVSGAKIISDDDVKKARDFRDAMDRLTDAAQNLELAAGKALVPFLTTLADSAGPIAEFVGNVLDARAALQQSQQSGKSSWWEDALATMTATGPEIFNIFADGLPILDDTSTKYDNVGHQVLKVGDIMKAGGRTYLELADRTKDVTNLTADQIEVLKNQALATQAAGSATEEKAAADKAAEQASKDYLKALQDLSKAQAEQAESFHAAADSQYAADKAARELSSTFEQIPDKLDKIAQSKDSDSEKTREQQQVYDDAAKAASDMADAQVKLESDQAKATGTTETHTRALDTWNASILTAAANAEGPLKTAIINHIAAVNGIPPEKVTEILAATPNLEEQKALIDKASANRKLTIEADANTDPATRAVNLFIQATENKTAYIDVVGRLSTQGQAHASGGSASGFALVGELGPELVSLPMGSYVYTAAQTKGMLAGMPAFAGGGIVGPVTGGAAATSNLSATDRAQLIDDLNNVLTVLAAVDPADVAKVAKLTDQVAAIRAQLHTSGVYTPGAGPDIVGASQGLTFTTSELKALAGTPLGEMGNVSAAMYAPAQTAWTPPPGGSQYDSPYFQSDFWKPGQGQIPVQSPSEIAANRARADSAALARADLARFGGTVINVYMPPGSDGEDVVRALKQYERRNGVVPVNTL